MHRKGITIHVDLANMSKKAVQKGPGYVLAETIYNLMLMANDALKPKIAPPGEINGKPHRKS